MSVLLLFLITLLGACANEEVHDPDLDQEIIDESDTTIQITPPIDLAEHQGPLGSYVGLFEAENIDFEKNPSVSNLINVTITEFTDGHIKGHSIVAGNDRPFLEVIPKKVQIFSSRPLNPVMISTMDASSILSTRHPI
ncbi:MAG: hypothetical protein HWD58_03650 [Bacteroidota bacterium]|nr:MAG: hypothetical protein HWD58_03650 [Bacteroidota bacterium]